MSERLDIDSDALRAFIASLKTFNQQFEAEWGRLESRWQASSETWRDAKKDQFTSQVGWEDVERQMRNYLNTSEQYTNFLVRLQERAQGYLDS